METEPRIGTLTQREQERSGTEVYSLRLDNGGKGGASGERELCCDVTFARANRTKQDHVT
jgi:hypothetical protein